MQSWLEQQTKNLSPSSMDTSLRKIHEAGTSDGWHGVISPNSDFRPEHNRYHLYIGLFCPFAHRVNLVRHLCGLTALIPISIVKPYPKGDEKGWPGWQFPKSDDEYPGATVDHLFGSEYLHEIYFKADPEYKGRYSVPVLWDKKTNTIVNNESAEMLRWLPKAFDSIQQPEDIPHHIDLYPSELGVAIDKLAVWIGDHLNNGVYKAGFAPDQETYDKNVIPVFGALNTLERVIAAKGGPFILGQKLTELDIRAYATVVRFDVVYVQHFKCNLGMIRQDYPHILAWLEHLYWNLDGWGFKETTNVKHIKENYTKSHYDINPKAITPRGPYPDVPSDAKTDFEKLNIGAVRLKEVVRFAEKLWLEDTVPFLETTFAEKKLPQNPKLNFSSL